ncbi:hypothetical protein N692_05545 [Lactiplantibacillus plantarum EGD-AQ4]|nr:hypothetical protein N692_05545 [Lactiplantibacillus plantarum EGD-AQ4]
MQHRQPMPKHSAFVAHVSLESNATSNIIIRGVTATTMLAIVAEHGLLTADC